jgi:putative toxin-antitoxin system antitoxin component (TIGR02293 family)
MSRKLDILQESEVLYAARVGVTRSKVYDVIEMAGITLTEMGRYVHMTARTLQRKDSKEKLPSDISEKVLLIQNLYIKGANVFGSIEGFREWMNMPNVALSNETPKSFLDTYTGIEYLMQELGRLEHGFVA